MQQINFTVDPKANITHAEVSIYIVTLEPFSELSMHWGVHTFMCWTATSEPGMHTHPS